MTKCKKCSEEFSCDNPQMIEGVVTENMCLCAECGTDILNRQYDMGLSDTSMQILCDPREILGDL